MGIIIILAGLACLGGGAYGAHLARQSGWAGMLDTAISWGRMFNMQDELDAQTRLILWLIEYRTVLLLVGGALLVAGIVKQRKKWNE